MRTLFELMRVIAIIALVVFAAALATPKGRLPLALRGLMKMLHKDAGTRAAADAGVPAGKRLWSFLIVLAAIALALV